MDKKKVIIYGVGGVALVGIALYLYNKNKAQTKSATDVTAPDNSMNDGTMGMGVVAIRPDTPMSAGAVVPTNVATPSGIVVPVVVPPTGNVTGAYSPNPSYQGGVVGDKVTTTPSTNDVTLFVDPPTTTPKVSPYSAYVVGSNSYYFADSVSYTNDINAILSNASIPLTQKTSAINVLRQLAIDSVTANTAIYGGILGFTKKQTALDSINSISDTAIANVQSQLSAIVSGAIKSPTTTTTTTTSTSSPVLVRAFDGGFSYADGRRYGGRKIGLSGFKNN